MAHARIKTFVGIAFFVAWIFLLVFIKTLIDKLPIVDFTHFHQPSEILLLYLNIPIFFIWLGLGLSFGLSSLIITCLSLVVFFWSKIYIFPLLTFTITSFIGYKLNRVFEGNIRSLGVQIEKMDEEENLLSEEINLEEKDIFRMRNSSKRIAHLKNVIEDYSLTLSEDDILDSIVRNSFELFKDANRVLLYLVDTQKQQLKLVRSKKKDLPYPIKAKKGDVFDAWVLKHRMPLLVEDINRDFRFSPEELDRTFNSIINSPLTSEHKIFGILRVDSVDKGKFTQSDLRFLDIIADLSCVSLQNAILYGKVKDLAIHDSLTGLYVHKYFIERLNEEIKRALRNNIEFSLLMLDLDNFKAYNDRYGHTAGDLVLKHIASILKSFAQPGDIVSRYGGEEFTILLVNKEKVAGTKIADEIRKNISKTPLFLRREKTSITVSIGVASCPSEERQAEEFLALVDSRLYKAKKQGRNRVCAD